MLLDHWYAFAWFDVVAIRSEEGSVKKKTPVPFLDTDLNTGFDRNTTTLTMDHEYVIPTKFHQNPSTGSGEEVENC